MLPTPCATRTHARVRACVRARSRAHAGTCTPATIADIPLTKAVAGVRVGYTPAAGFIINPTASQMAASSLDLMMAGTADAVLMIEGFCEWLSEEEMLQVR